MSESKEISCLHFSCYITRRKGYNIVIPNVKGDSVIDEKDAWNSFVQSGSVLDYLQYKSVSYAKRNGEVKEDKDEVQDQGTGAQTAEYR